MTLNTIAPECSTEISDEFFLSYLRERWYYQSLFTGRAEKFRVINVKRK